MYVCIYVRICIYIYVCVCMYKASQACVRVCEAASCVASNVVSYVCVAGCMGHFYSGVSLQMCSVSIQFIYIYIYTHTHTDTHTHTYTNMQSVDAGKLRVCLAFLTGA